MTITTTHETPFHAQRRKMRNLKDKQEAGGIEEPQLSSKSRQRRLAEQKAIPKVSKKVSKKSKSTSD